MLPLGFLIFPYLINLIFKTSKNISSSKLFFNGFFFGYGFLIVYLSWIHNPFLVNENTKAYAFISMLLPLFISIFFGLGFLIFKFIKNFIILILIIPFIFTLIELIISNFIYGFPWVSNSLILSNNLFGFYLIKYFGTLTSGYIIISIFSLTTFLLYTYKVDNFRKYVFLAYSPIIFTLIIPFFPLFFDRDNTSKNMSIDVYQLLNPINVINKEKIEENISYIINNSDSDFIIFAENNYPYLIDKNKSINLMQNIKDEKKVIIGATTYEDGNYKNSFLLIEKDKISIFDKKILVPFGEFLPFRKYLNFMETISGSVDFKTGQLQRFIKTKNNINILPVICYEIIFDKIFKNVNKNEIDIIINITNDSWFGNKIGPYQHFYITRLKSLISNKPLIRVSNNGISAIIDNNGIIIKSSKLNEVSNFKYKLKTNNQISYFNLHKIIVCYLFFIFLFLLVFSRKQFYEKKF